MVKNADGSLEEKVWKVGDMFSASIEKIVSWSENAVGVAENAQWIEDNSTLQTSHKKKNVAGVSYKTVNLASESGDASPSTPIGANLPNNNWIRDQHVSKSVSLENIIEACNMDKKPTNCIPRCMKLLATAADK